MQYLKASISHLLISFIIMILSISCVSEGAKKGRQTIKKFGDSLETDDSGICQEIYNVATAECLESCPAGTHLATEEEKAEAQNELSLTTGLSSDQLQEILDNITTAVGGICVNGNPILRPTDAIVVKSDFCACKDKKPDIVNKCDNFCLDKTDTASVLYGSVLLKEAVSLNTLYLGNLENWCTNEIPGGLQAPGCFLQVYDGASTQSLPIEIPADSNSFKVNIESLDYQKVYVAKIVESQSGSHAETSSFQIYKKIPDDTDVSTPLKIMPVSQYSCITRSSEDINGELNYLLAAKIHFYFASSATPPALPPGIRNTICHDINTTSPDDSSLYPRFELIPQHFAVWDQSDLRFTDQNGDNRPDINTQLEQRLLSEAGIRRTLNIFNLLNWPNMPAIENFDQIENPNVGFFMQPWINEQTGRGFCPKQEQFNGSDPLFKILKEVVGVDTEGIYLAESEAIVQDSGATIRDVMIIREGLLQNIWFYYENGLHLEPDEVTASSQTIMFYWPADPANPFIKKSDQKLYTVRFPTDIGNAGVSSGLNTTVKPPDKRFGCVPALD